MYTWRFKLLFIVKCILFISIKEIKGLSCFIGVALGSHAQDVTGATMPCSGMCSNVTLAIHNTVATIFTCDPFDVCSTIEINNECKLQWLDITMCCCEKENYCNVKDWILEKAQSQTSTEYTEGIIPSNVPPQKTIECYVGIDFYDRMEFDSNVSLLNSKKRIETLLHYYILMVENLPNIRMTSINIIHYYLLNRIIPNFINMENENSNNLLAIFNENFVENNDNMINPDKYLYDGRGLVIKMNCTGSCANTTLGDEGMVYFCDPEYFCMTHDLLDKCNDMNFLLKSCCCSDPSCNMIYDDFDNDTTLATFFPENSTTLSSNGVKKCLFNCYYFISLILLIIIKK
uniref:Activin_recp domain-containing protein n=1 Tax=Parastrongyloides trichosuri TaxID=131310 RepID=A0A0N4ZKK3_PARTI